MKVQPPLRELKKERTKEALEKAAHKLFREKGYANTSVAEIAAAAEVSRRTFFRYFRSKEGVVFANADENGRRLSEAIELEPHGIHPLRAFGNAAVRLTRSETDPARIEEVMARQRLFLDNLELRSRLSEIARVWSRLLAEALARRDGRDTPDEDDLLFAAIGVALIQTTVDQWTQNGGTDDLADRLEENFAKVTV